MLAIITGDIINSENYTSSEWMDILKKYLSRLGESPAHWEIYRGDEFQLRIKPEQALRTAIHIKAIIKSIKGLDVRIGIGIGTETFTGTRVSESNGTAHQRSGRTFETLKKQKLNLAIATANKVYDRRMNLLLKLALDFMDDWSQVSAEVVALSLEKPNALQQQVSEQLKIQQSAVSQRQKRARLDLVLELLDYYTQTLKEISE
ncbi:MAG: SatD family protein [Saonia sp.]